MTERCQNCRKAEAELADQRLAMTWLVLAGVAAVTVLGKKEYDKNRAMLRRAIADSQ